MLVLTHAAITWLLAGLIWTIQLVHYPLFLDVGTDRFSAYHRRHMLRISLLILPLVAAEAVLAVALVRGSHRNDRLSWIGLALIIINAAATALIHAPLHVRLEKGRDEKLLRRLTLPNWIRTIAWSARAILALAIIRSTPA